MKTIDVLLWAGTRRMTMLSSTSFRCSAEHKPSAVVRAAAAPLSEAPTADARSALTQGCAVNVRLCQQLRAAAGLPEAREEATTVRGCAALSLPLSFASCGPETVPVLCRPSLPDCCLTQRVRTLSLGVEQLEGRLPVTAS